MATVSAVAACATNIRAATIIVVLVYSQGLQRIDAAGAECREQAGEKRDDAEQQRQGNEGDRIGRADAVNQARQQPRRPERREDANAKSGDDRLERSVQHQSENLVAAGTQKLPVSG